MAETRNVSIKFFLNVAREKLLKSASVSRSYSKIIVARFYGPRYMEVNNVFEQFTCQRQKQRISNCCI